MRTTKLTCLALAATLALTLWGCGSSRDASTSTTGEGTIETAQTLGIDNCATCHLLSVGIEWMFSTHGNMNDFPNAGLTDPACLACHDQLGDGQKMDDAFGIFLTPLASAPVSQNRPVVGCESCHGGGQYHRGVGPIPYARPGADRCGQCHNANFPHGESPEGAAIVEAYSSSPHSRSLNDHVFTDATKSAVRATCSKCHTDEGAKEYRAEDGDHDALVAALGAKPALVDATVVSCATCHDAHNVPSLLEQGTSTRSAEFNTCTNCHQLVTATNAKIVTYHDPTVNPYGSAGEIITDTHFATAGNFVNGTNNADVTGYAMDFSNDRVCRDCHNQHNADTTINKQWAESRHADKTAAGAWAHYNWTETPGGVRNDGTVISATGSRASCQRCHTTTGVRAYLAANEDGDASDYVAPLAFNPSFKPEMLECWGCHANNLGGLRQTGAITADYSYINTNFVTGVETVVLEETYTYPDVKGSNICMSCHTGRQNGETIKNLVSANGITIDFTNLSFINSHYLTAGGTVFTATGYEYPTLSYANVSYYAHDKIGTAAEPGTGSEGPCIGCHLTSAESHSFVPFKRDEAAAGQPITAITSTVCIECHDGAHGPAFVAEGGDAAAVAAAAAFLNLEEEDFAAALSVLDASLAERGFLFSPSYPYFYNDLNANGVLDPAEIDRNNGVKNWNSVGDADTTGATTGKGNMGAAFNFNLLEHDPGAFVHNRMYAKRLIFDSIDWLDDNVINASTGDAIAQLLTDAKISTAVADAAVAYLDGGAAEGVQRP